MPSTGEQVKFSVIIQWNNRTQHENELITSKFNNIEKLTNTEKKEA